ncbi:MAG: HAD family phosphatase [Patescibacteria group bacterium]
MSQFEAVLYDMDGVIADTEPFHVEAEILTCVERGFNIDPNDWGGFKGRTANYIFGHLIENFGDPEVHTVDELIDRKTEIFLKITRGKLNPIEGVLDFMNWTQSISKKNGLVTSSNSRVQKHIVDSFNIGDSFDCIITGDDITRGKPHPEPYLRAIKNLSVKPEDTLVVEDSNSGIESGLAAGCMVLGIATSHTPEELKEANPTLIAVDYADARRQIESLLVS